MLKTYNVLFDRYLRACKQKYKTEDDLEECCRRCKRFQYQLLGMLNIMEELNIITSDENDKEWERIIKEFSTHRLYNCYLKSDNQVYIWKYLKEGVE